VELRPLDDPLNPWRGQYEAWDRWALQHYGGNDPERDEHMRRQSDELQAAARLALKEGRVFNEFELMKPYEPGPDSSWRDLHVYVDPQGFQIPMRAVWQRELSTRSLRPGQGEPPSRHYSYHAGGKMDSELLQAYDGAHAQMIAGAAPRIPAWLAEAAPEHCVFMTDGRIAVESRDASGGRLWRLCSPEGELVWELPAAGLGDWREFYGEELDRIRLNATARGQTASDWFAGTLLLLEEPGGRIVGAYDYTGKPLPVSEPIYFAPLSGTLISGQELAQTYALQQAGGG
jgi:hypothetical protein